jgi:predicted PurR-regulated permease PerM
MIKRPSNIIFWISLVLIIIAAVYYVFNLVFYFAVSVVLMLICEPAISYLSKAKIGKKQLHIPRYILAIFSLLFFYGLVSLIVIAVLPSVNEQIQTLSRLDLSILKEKFYLLLLRAENIYNALYPETDKNVIEFIQEKLIEFFNPKHVTQTIGNTLQFTGNIFVALFSISFISFFLIKDKEELKDKIFKIIPAEEKHAIAVILQNCRKTLSRYFVGLFVQVSCIFILISVSLGLLGINNALLIATVCAILNIIPYIGPLMGMLFAFFIVSSTYLNADTSMLPFYIKTYIVLFSVQLIDNIVLQPLIFSKSIKAHPLEIFAIVIAAGTLYGVLGMLLAIPVYSVIRISLKQVLFNE